MGEEVGRTLTFLLPPAAAKRGGKGDASEDVSRVPLLSPKPCGQPRRRPWP